MPGTLYVIGIGPGDPELLTLKAVRIIKDTEVLCVPRGREEGNVGSARPVITESAGVFSVRFPFTC